jgi:hypothetical protein
MSIPHDVIIYSHEIDRAVEALDANYAHAEDADDYTALTDFRDDVMGIFGTEAWETGISFVADNYWETYAETCAKDRYGEAVDSNYWNAALYASDLQSEFKKIELDGVTYWTDGIA